MDSIQKNLLAKALNGNLGHFFILNPPGRAKNPKADLMKWCQAIIKEFFAQGAQQVKDLKNNEDVLIIDSDMVNKKFYDKAFVHLISQFLSHAATRSDRKFIIIEELDKMSSVHSNKLLKIFEEPPVNATIFLLNPTLSKALATISSRAVTVRTSLPLEDEPKDLASWAKKLDKKDLHQFCDYFKTRQDEEKALSQAVLEQISSQADSQLFLKTEKYLKSHTEDALYNHNSYSRLTLLREIYLSLATPRQA